jgi:hypothetical protein
MVPQLSPPQIRGVSIVCPLIMRIFYGYPKLRLASGWIPYVYVSNKKILVSFLYLSIDTGYPISEAIVKFVLHFFDSSRIFRVRLRFPLYTRGSSCILVNCSYTTELLLIPIQA